MSMKDICWAAYNSVPPGMEPGLEAVSYYDPPNMTYPFGAYICVMNIDVDTGVYKIRRFYALDDCGTRINPMIIEGQVHGGLTEAFAIAMGQEIRYDDEGNVVTGSFMDFFMPTAVETPHWETDFTVTPSPHHPIGAKGVGESPNVGGVPAFSNAVNDAFSFLGTTHIQMPHDYWRNWRAAKNLGVFASSSRFSSHPRRPMTIRGMTLTQHEKPRRDRAALASGYIADGELATAISLMQLLRRPLLLEGEAGVGKTEVAKALAAVHATELIRLQCYEGLDQSAALYEWNYQRQLLSIQAHRGEDADAIEDQIFSEKYLLERPLLAAIRRDKPPVLLIDEIDRADDEFEAFLLELLSDFQVSIPELGTISATTIPHVVLTSNGTRELSDALRRRCLYHYVDYPDVDREARIIMARIDGAGASLSLQIARHGRGHPQGRTSQGARRRGDTGLGRRTGRARRARPARCARDRARDPDVPAQDA